MLFGQGNAETSTGVIAFAIGVFLLVTGIQRGAADSIVLGVAFTIQGIISLALPRILPAAPQLSAEQARARRVAVTVFPTGILYVLAALALLVIVPMRDRSGLTTAIAIALLVLGVFNMISGIGARRRVQRPDSPQLSEVPDSKNGPDR